MDPWGDQRADMRAARAAWAVLQVNSKDKVDEADLLLFPDDANDLPEDIDAREKAWMLKLQRSGD